MAHEPQVKKSTQIIPEVLKAMISAELPNKIRFLPLAEVDYELVGNPGDTVKMPSFLYSGDAVVVPEGEEIPVTELKTQSKEVTIHKVAKGFEITDETLLSAYGNPQAEAVKQIGMGISNAIDNQMLEELQKAKLTASVDVTKVDGINTAIEMFNDEDQEPLVLFLSPKDASKLRKDAGIDFTRASDLGDNILITGAFGEVLGATIYRSRKIKDGEGLLVKRGALKLFLKRDVFIEKERYASRKCTGIFGDEHFAPYLYDESKVVKMTKGGTTATTAKTTTK